MKIGQQLPFTVECKSTHPFFELIAAFHCRPAAEGYAAECKVANPAYEYRVSNPIPELPNHDLKDASDVAECMIVGRLVRDLLAAGYTLSVYDGEEETVSFATTEQPIFDALSSTDQDILYANMGAKRSFVSLVWGNGVDVISDYSMSLEAIIAPIYKLAEELGS